MVVYKTKFVSIAGARGNEQKQNVSIGNIFKAEVYCFSKALFNSN